MITNKPTRRANKALLVDREEIGLASCGWATRVLLLSGKTRPERRGRATLRSKENGVDARVRYGGSIDWNPEDIVQVFLEYRGPLYGLTSWEGVKCFREASSMEGSWHGQRAPHERHFLYSLEYKRAPQLGDELPSPPFVVVSTTDDFEKHLEADLIMNAEQGSSVELSMVGYGDEVAGSHRSTLEVAVDGEAHVAEVLSRGDCHAASVAVGPVNIRVAASGVALSALSLGVVQDFTEYIECWRFVMERLGYGRHA